jgi:hypothetical protein
MRVAVVGAGIAGLVAARRLAGDHDVVVLEKNAAVGGRLATRRLGDALVDSGAQFFTVRGSAFSDQVDDWVGRDLAHVWCRGFHRPEDGYPRFVGSAGMASLALDLAADLDVRVGRMVFTLRRRETGWDVVTDDGTIVAADRVILTCPVAQAWALLAQSDVELPDDLAHREYHRTIALLVALDSPSAVPDPGGVQFDPTDPTNEFGFVTDSMAKGISQDDPLPELESALIERGRRWIGSAGIIAAQIAKWRFAGPVRTWPEPCWRDESGTVVIAGDLFAGPKVEGAFNSGLAAAQAVSRP